MINEIVMALMFVALFVLVLFAVIVGSRVSKTKTQPTPETVEEPPKAPPKTREPSVEERPPVEVEQAPVSRDVFEDEEQYLQVSEPEFLMPEQSVEIPGLELEVPEPETEFSEPGVELPEPEIEESMPESDEGEPEVVLPEPVLLETPQAEEPAVDEAFMETYREPDYFRDDDVSPVQGVTTCPHCGEKVPATLYCINCGKSLNE
ncbi:MAG TPA: hypothetical protein VMW03_04375 [Candidatus Krumholzibacteriaceae bacterium]|nr:hypothetical protein [Candidatus Krumholzibacteriaceae bacterium]